MNNKLGLFRSLMEQAGNPYRPPSNSEPHGDVGVAQTYLEHVTLDVQQPEPVHDNFDNDDLESFYTLISKVKLNCYKLRQKSKEHEKAAESLSAMVGTAESVKAANDEFIAIQNDAAQVIRETKAIFDKIKEMCDPETGLTTLRGLDTSHDNINDYEKLSFAKPEFRMVVSAKNSAQKNWADAVQEYTELDSQISKEFRELHRRHFKMQGQEVDDEQLDELTGRHDAFAMAMTMTSEADMRFAQQHYFEARAKEELVNEIYEAQMDVRDMWANLGLLVEHHGQMLNNIYANVEKSQAVVKDGNENLAKVQTIKSSSNRCRCFVLLGLTIIACAVIVPSVAVSS